MSLAMYAAPFDDTSINNNNNNNEKDDFHKKKQTHNKTQKKYQKDEINQDRVNSVLESIHNHSRLDEEDTLGDFPPNPQSIGSFKAGNTKEQMLNMGNNVLTKSLGLQPLPNYGDSSTEDLELNNFSSNYGDNKSTEEYYKKYIPNYPSNKGHRNQNQNQNSYPSSSNNYSNINKMYYPSVNNGYFSQQSTSESHSENDVLIQKLNYMINLLEEKQDEKTNNVTEEIILYSFLGIFIIFIVDSFTRVGKYVR